MGIVARWNGAGVADGTAVDETTAGTGDQHFDSVTDGPFTVDADGGAKPRIQMDQAASSVAQLTWQAATIGTLTDHAVRAYFELSGYPTAGTPVLQAYASGDTSLRWRLDVNVSGLLRLRDAGNTVVATAAVALPVGERLRIEPVIAGTAASVNVWVGDTEDDPLVTLAGAVGAGCDSVRFGNPQTAPTLPVAYYDSLAVADNATPIGPRTHRASGVWAAGVALASGGRAVHHASAGWAAAVDLDGAPHVRRRASAAWSLDVGMRIYTGDPPISAMTDGQWLPANIRRLTSGAWQPS